MTFATSISNIAWPADQDDAALELVLAAGFSGVELAPRKVFGPWSEIDLPRARAYRTRVAAMGLRIPALQAILFDVQDCELFRSTATRANLRAHLGRVAELAHELGAQACVYGAPTLRDPGDLPISEAWRIAVEFFTDVATTFEAAGTVLAFEPNPPAYKCRFITTTPEACRLVTAIGRPGIRVNIDGGTIFLNAESMQEVIAAAPYAAHFHASEPHLVPLGSTGADHRAVAAALAAGGYAGWRSVEMRAEGDWQAHLNQAARIVRECYGTRD